MTRQEACKILGISGDADENTIKKSYRKLMHKAHPDAVAFLEEETKLPYTAQELNEAYTLLMQEEEEESPYFRKTGQSGKTGQRRRRTGKTTDTTNRNKEQENWKAPINSMAYCNRKVFHGVEDGDGDIIGTFCVAEGKYFWIPDEDFTLFQKSIYLAGKELLDEIDEERGYGVSYEEKMPVMAELAYLLSAQFIDSVAAVKHLAERYGDNEDFHVQATVELSNCKVKLKEGEYVYPSGMKNHRLFLKNGDGEQVGYVSFRDDRLYYVIIPLFEQKSVQIKMNVKTVKDRKLDLWIRFQTNEKNTYPESIGMQIEALLKRYRNKK